ncbi:MAG: MBL fold metallo-hydrolase [Nannocystaceae bacterium]
MVRHERRSRFARGFAILLITVAVALIPGIGDVAATGESGSEAALRWVDVGQGAAMIAVDGDVAVVIDSGPSAAAEPLLAALDAHGVRRVDLWIHTHFDADHLGGVLRAVDGADAIAGTGDDLEITSLWDRGLEAPPSTGVMERYLARFADRRSAPALGDRWARGRISVEVVGIGAGPQENARGLALRVEVSAITAAVLGDLPAAEGVVAAARAGPVDVLWASHHGARGGFDPALLEPLDPGLVVISAGHDNRYCHPAPEVLAWLADRPVWITGAAGVAAHGRCPALAPALGPEHEVRGEDLVLRAGE